MSVIQKGFKLNVNYKSNDDDDLSIDLNIDELEIDTELVMSIIDSMNKLTELMMKELS